MSRNKDIRILLVEDDESLGFVLKDNLEVAGYTVDLGKTGQEGYELFLQQPYHIALLDVMLPEKDGFTLAADIRKINEELPIIFITAKSMEQDKIKGFQAGADDYITKPFSNSELQLRIEAILKRSLKQEQTPANKDSFTIGKFTFDYRNQTLTFPGLEAKSLTKKEANLLRLLCQHENNVIERETVLKVVWGEDDYFLGRSMDVFITRLRKYLKADETIKIINVHGVGFKLETQK